MLIYLNIIIFANFIILIMAKYNNLSKIVFEKLPKKPINQFNKDPFKNIFDNYWENAESHSNLNKGFKNNDLSIKSNLKDYTDEQRLLYFLLKNYEKSVRPVRNASQTIVVKLGMTLTNIFDVVRFFIKAAIIKLRIFSTKILKIILQNFLNKKFIFENNFKKKFGNIFREFHIGVSVMNWFT